MDKIERWEISNKEELQCTLKIIENAKNELEKSCKNAILNIETNLYLVQCEFDRFAEIINKVIKD